MRNRYEQWLDGKKAGQITIDDEFARLRNPDWEWTRQQHIDHLLKQADERDALANWYEKNHGHIYAQGLRQAAQGNRSLAALMRR